MEESWLELEVQGDRSRHPLRRGLTRVGGPGGDVAIAAADSDQLQVWDRPPKLVFVGQGEPPRVNGRAVEEAGLSDGDVLEWRGMRAVFRTRAAAIEELPPEPATPAAAPAAPAGEAVLGPTEEIAWRRLKAGMLVELGLAERGAARRWQDAVVRGEFEPDACARDILASTSQPREGQLAERSARLERDLLMVPVTRGLRGAGRRARGAARGGAAFVISQFVVVAVYSVLILVALLLVRLRWGWSVDEFLDGVRGLVPG